ncbi:AbrB/MazE/SpoVT family DNA-binding domain-containing protein [Erysipelothrix sp. HDW6B]|uniref:AbrB/MazE/SpoVT family DNA-binding domain-containing protein n=1 Tax=Erysipelothrix sp. HDW6B TaxID=2714929 RepID=UPI00140DF64B|nr:AbrB/MazE/SpoVT family DNA-binding domain-containing protein [Erysipelothrix sp. HDW6B]QIK86619.1 AbrB/MazE/SpoVT family DNA-binding domain-containing protein [Erysipelothrix sp. HDW6B]
MKTDISVFKVLDDKGRVVIPKEHRDIASLQPGDVIKIIADTKGITLRKVGIVDHDAQSSQDIESVIQNALNSLPQSKQLKVAKIILQTLERNQTND